VQKIITAALSSVIIFIFLCFPTWANPNSNSFFEHLRITWKTSPQTQANISWTSRNKIADFKIHIDSLSHKGIVKSYKLTTNPQHQGTFSGSSEKAFYHHVLVKDLKASTKYYFVISSGQKVSKEYSFITAPEDYRNFTLLFGGDSRSGHRQRIEINKVICKMHTADPNIIALAHGGDYVNKGSKWNEWDKWLSHNELLINDNGLILPIIPAKGNHDSGPIYPQIFNIKKNEEVYFSSRLSPMAKLITLNTNGSVKGDQNNFLENALKTGTEKKTTWLLAQYHAPLYPAVKEPNKAKSAWTSLFEKYNLTIALEADGHCIKRTLPIRKDKHDPINGVVYVGEGGLGVGQRQPKLDRWYLKEPGMATNGTHVMRLDFELNKLTYKVIMLDGSVKDSYIFMKNINVDPSLYKLLKPLAIQFIKNKISIKSFAEKLNKIIKDPKSDEAMKKEASALKENLSEHINTKFDHFIKKANTQPIEATEDIKLFLKTISQLEVTSSLEKRYAELIKNDNYKSSIEIDTEIQKCLKKIKGEKMDSKKNKRHLRKSKCDD